MNDPFRFASSTDALVTDDPTHTSPPDRPDTPAPAPASTPAPAQSAAEERFASCRWRKPETPPYCTHPEVLPFAGMNGFKPDAWCPGCAFYKLRRNPRKDY
jgi:hypothetical protein